MIRSKLASVAGHLPGKVWTNNDLTQLMDTSDEWIRQRTGIEQRYWIDDPNLANSDIALVAAEEALKKANLPKEKLDMIILATLSPDHEFPGTACFLQGKLGVPGIPALDVRQQCTGFLYGLSIADQFIRNGVYKNILVVGSEIHSKGLDKTTRGRDVTVLFGDGAGAAVVSAVEVQDPKKESCIWSTHLHSDGSFAKELWIPGPGTGFGVERMTHEMIDHCDHYPKMNGKTVFVHAVKRMSECIIEGLKSNQVSLQDVDLFVFHQANLRINEMVAKQLEIPESKIFNTIQKFGNTTAATLPLGLFEAEKAGVLKPGMLVAMAAFGSGFTWASGLMRW